MLVVLGVILLAVLGWVALDPDPLNALPGPPRSSFWSGNLAQLFSPSGWSFHAALTAVHGRVVRLHALPLPNALRALAGPRLYVSDPRALYALTAARGYPNTICGETKLGTNTHASAEMLYARTPFFERINLMCFGPGLVAVDGAQHTRQRRMMQPVFGRSAVRRLRGVFAEIACELVNALHVQVPPAPAYTRDSPSSEKATSTTTAVLNESKPVEVDILRVAKRTALEYIARAALGYSFGALDGGSSGNRKDRSGLELGLDLDGDCNKNEANDEYELSSDSDGCDGNENGGEGHDDKMTAAREARAYNAAVRDFAPTLFTLSIIRQLLPLLPRALLFSSSTPSPESSVSSSTSQHLPPSTPSFTSSPNNGIKAKETTPNKSYSCLPSFLSPARNVDQSHIHKRTSVPEIIIQTIRTLSIRIIARISRRIRRLVEISHIMARTARRIMRAAVVEAQLESESTDGSQDEDEEKAGKRMRRKDIVSVLLRANAASAEKDRLTAEEVEAQMGIMIFAGHETTATALCRALHALAAHPCAQERLRREVQGVLLKNGNIKSHSEQPTGANKYDAHEEEDSYENEDSDESEVDFDLDRLPYLDAVVRETLRLYPPVYMVHRTVTQDTVLPLAFPVALHPTEGTIFTLVKNAARTLWKSIIPSLEKEKRDSSSKEGATATPTTASSETQAQTQTTTQLPLRAGTQVTLALGAANRDPAIWGPDAARWRPGRWLKTSSFAPFFNGCGGASGSKSRTDDEERLRIKVVNGDQPSNGEGKDKADDGVEVDNEESEDGWSMLSSASPINGDKGNTCSGSEEAWRVPGVYSGIMTFLDGRRSCIGYRFAVLEMKYVLAHLVAHFSFALPPATNGASDKVDVVPDSDVKSGGRKRTKIRWRLGGIVSPCVDTGSEAMIGSAAASCPLLVSRAPILRSGSADVGDDGAASGNMVEAEDREDAEGEEEESEWEEMEF